MHWHGDIHIDCATPTETDVLRALGVPVDHEPDARTRDLVREGIAELRRLAKPRGIFSSVTTEEFADIYRGEGDNNEPSPLADVFPKADELALFAATIGSTVTERVSELFNAGEYALGGALDAAASEAAELVAGNVARTVLAKARHAGRASEATRVLNYSPGYCGWSLTGQGALFAALEPCRIGVTLTDSFLMEPVKSVSGVAVVGPAGIHDFKDDYAFCGACRTHECRDRIAGLRGATPRGDSYEHA